MGNRDQVETITWDSVGAALTLFPIDQNPLAQSLISKDILFSGS